MAAPAYFLASTAPSFPLRFHLPTTATTRSLSTPAPSAPKTTNSCSLSVRSRRPTFRRNSAETYVPGSGKYIAPDYLVKKVSAKEVEELVRGERKVPLIVDFYATWCGPCVLMAQHIEMLAVEYEDNALFVKVDTDDEYEFARDMQPYLLHLELLPAANAMDSCYRTPPLACSTPPPTRARDASCHLQRAAIEIRPPPRAAELRPPPSASATTAAGVPVVEAVDGHGPASTPRSPSPCSPPRATSRCCCCQGGRGQGGLPWRSRPARLFLGCRSIFFLLHSYIYLAIHLYLFCYFGIL